MCVLALPLHGGAGQSVVERFVAHREAVPLTQYRAIRRMWARNDRFTREARLTVRTLLDQASGFRYEVLTQDGSTLVRDRALLPILKTEARAMSDGTATRSALTPTNYDFTPGHEEQWLLIRPLRRDSAKSPSFWTSRVEVVRQYQRIGGVRVPIHVASLAWIRLVGVSMFEMAYEYEEINGKPVGRTLSINQR